jgi:hypothetical protein
LARLWSIASLKPAKPLANLEDDALHGVGCTGAGGGTGFDDDEFFAVLEAGDAVSEVSQCLMKISKGTAVFRFRLQQPLYGPE